MLAITFLATHRAACDLAGTSARSRGRFGALHPGGADPDRRGRESSGRADTVRPRDGVRRRSARTSRALLSPRPAAGRERRSIRATVRRRPAHRGRSGRGRGSGSASTYAAVARCRPVPTGWEATRGAQTRVYQAIPELAAAAVGAAVHGWTPVRPGVAPVGLVDGMSALLDRGGLERRRVRGAASPSRSILGCRARSPNSGATCSGTVGRLARALVDSRPGSPDPYLRSGTNREFLYLQGDYGTRRLSLSTCRRRSTTTGRGAAWVENGRSHRPAPSPTCSSVCRTRSA